MAATTSIDDTGLLDVLIAAFTKSHPDIELSSLAVGTGQAIELGRRGDADVLFTHDSVAELRLVDTGAATHRQSVMYNNFIIAGPPSDPAHARGTSVADALQAITAKRAPFISRGDDSGTHRRELELWQHAGIDSLARTPDWYFEAGVGMGDALLIAAQKDGYILTDRGTYLRFRSRLDLDVICEGDPPLINNYGVTVMKGERSAAAKIFAEWLVGTEGQRLIGEFGRSEFGQSLFSPSAHGAALHDTIPTGER